MATTSWHDIPGTNPQLQMALNYDSISRTNNTVTLNGLNSRMRINISGGFDNTRWHASIEAAADGDSYTVVQSDRQVKASGTSASNGQEFASSESSPSFSVGASDTSGKWRGRGGDPNVNNYVSEWDLDIPNLGSPSTTETIDSAQITSIKARPNVTSWGSNATSGSVRSYIADNSSFGGQTSITTTDNALVTHSGLTSNTKYWLRGWASNGGGLSAYSSAVTSVTLPNAPVAGTPDVLATTATIPTTINAGGGFYAITKQYSYRKVGDADWSAWTTYATDDIELSGLLPNTDYEIRVQSVTTAGTTVGSTTTFTTLPAGKLIYSDGTVKNAIPRVVMPDGTVSMLNINLVQEE